MSTSEPRRYFSEQHIPRANSYGGIRSPSHDISGTSHKYRADQSPRPTNPVVNTGAIVSFPRFAPPRNLHPATLCAPAPPLALHHWERFNVHSDGSGRHSTVSPLNNDIYSHRLWERLGPFSDSHGYPRLWNTSEHHLLYPGATGSDCTRTSIDTVVQALLSPRYSPAPLVTSRPTPLLLPDSAVTSRAERDGPLDRCIGMNGHLIPWKHGLYSLRSRFACPL